MNKIILTLLVSILGVNVFGFFFKDQLDFSFEKAPLKNSSSCVNLSEKETFSCLTEVVDHGEVQGNDLFLLGQMQLYGMGTESNPVLAIKLLERSAVEFDNDEAMTILGNLAINRDALAGKYWYSRAASRGNLEAQLKLANIYRHGEEKDQDPELAFELYKSAANQGSLDAQYEQALMYAMGIGVAPNLDRSLFMLEAPCDRGHAESCALMKRIQELKRNQ